MSRSCENEEQEVHFGLETLRVAPLHLVANPLPGREHEFAAPQLAWLKVDGTVRIVDRAPPTGPVVVRPVSPAELKRAADFLWTLNCRFEKPQVSVLQLRKPFPPRVARYLPRYAPAGNCQEPDCESQP